MGGGLSIRLRRKCHLHDFVLILLAARVLVAHGIAVSNKLGSLFGIFLSLHFSQSLTVLVSYSRPLLSYSVQGVDVRENISTRPAAKQGIGQGGVCWKRKHGSHLVSVCAQREGGGVCLSNMCSTSPSM